MSRSLDSHLLCVSYLLLPHQVHIIHITTMCRLYTSGALFVVVTLSSPSVSYSCLRKNVGCCISAEIRAATWRWAAPVLTCGICQCCNTRRPTLRVTCLGWNNNSELKSICLSPVGFIISACDVRFGFFFNVNQTCRESHSKCVFLNSGSNIGIFSNAMVMVVVLLFCYSNLYCC